MKSVTYKINSASITVTAQDVIELCVGDGALTSGEIDYFLHKCESEKANPFIHEIYIFKYNIAPAQIVVTQELMLKRAREMDTFAGMEDGVFVIDLNRTIVQRRGILVCPGETVVGGWCSVHVKGIDTPFYEALPLQYYMQNNEMWQRMPGIMIRKVARVAALRSAFPAQCSSYSPEELHTQPEIQKEFEYDECGNIMGLKSGTGAETAPDSMPVQEPCSQPTESVSEVPVISTETPVVPAQAVKTGIPQFETVEPVQDGQSARSGVAGNPESLEKETHENMTYEDAMKHVGEYGPLAGMNFGDVMKDASFSAMLTMYGNCMTGKDQSAARAILSHAQS